MKDTTGLGLGYRFIWRLEYAGLTVWGPAQVTPTADPKSRLRLERALKVRDAHEKRGTQPPKEILDWIERRGAQPPFKLSRG